MAEDTVLAIAFLVSLGAFTGFFSGILGIGGGIVVVPVLIVGLPFLGVDSTDIPKIAVATSLALVVPTALASAQAHAGRKNIDWRILLLLTPSFVAGAFVTAAFMTGFNTNLILLVFIAFALHTASRLYRGWRPYRHQGQPRPGLSGLTVRGVLGGALSALLGIGGGMVAVSLLERFVSLPRAIGTAAALALPMAIAGTAAYLAAPQGCASCIGFVYPPAVAAVGISAVLAAPLGAWAAQALPVHALRKLFAVVLVIAAGGLGYKTFTPDVIATEMTRMTALGKRLMPPRNTLLRPVEAPSWIGREPAKAPYLALAERYGPQRAFLLLVVDHDEVGPMPAPALFARLTRSQPNWFDPVDMQADITRVLARTSTEPKAPVVTSAVIAGERKTNATIKRKPLVKPVQQRPEAGWLQ